MATTTAGTWGLAELATQPGVGLATVDLGSLGRTVGLIAAAGVAVPAAVLAYHRQRALDTANHVASNQHDHKVNTDRVEHRTGVERHLRERYTTCAEQLGNEKSSAIRLAGVYALASLADDWHDFGNDSERQVCIDLLSAYLRTQRRPPTDDGGRPEEESRYRSEEHQVRTAIISTIRARTKSQDGPWIRCKFDLFRADLTRADLTGADLTGANLTGADLTRANLTGADLTRANLIVADLTDADLTRANLTDANLTGANLTGANLIVADLIVADLTGADLTGAYLTRADLTRANLAGANLAGANLLRANLTDADLEECRYSDLTKWPDGFEVPSSAVRGESQEEPDPHPV